MFLKPVLPVIEYVINYDYITKVLCENKAKPQMNCNGKCHLMKELAKASENERPISSDKKSITQEFEILFLENLQSYRICSIFFCDKLKFITNYSNLYFHLNSDSVFRPPIFIS